MSKSVLVVDCPALACVAACKKLTLTGFENVRMFSLHHPDASATAVLIGTATSMRVTRTRCRNREAGSGGAGCPSRRHSQAAMANRCRQHHRHEVERRAAVRKARPSPAEWSACRPWPDAGRCEAEPCVAGGAALPQRIDRPQQVSGEQPGTSTAQTGAAHRTGYRALPGEHNRIAAGIIARRRQIRLEQQAGGEHRMMIRRSPILSHVDGARACGASTAPGTLPPPPPQSSRRGWWGGRCIREADVKPAG